MTCKRNVALSLLCLATSYASASTFGITSRGDVFENDSLWWNQFDNPQTLPAVGFTTNGVKTVVSGPPDFSQATSVVTSSSAPYSTGNGDLWWAFGNGTDIAYFTDSVTINFAATQSRVGARIMGNSFGDYVAMITAYDATNSYLGSASVSLSSNGDDQDYAPFLGIGSTGMDIAKITYSLVADPNSTNPGNPALGYALDYVSIRDCQPVPEPATMAVMGLGISGLVARRRRR